MGNFLPLFVFVILFFNLSISSFTQQQKLYFDSFSRTGTETGWNNKKSSYQEEVYYPDSCIRFTFNGTDSICDLKVIYGWNPYGKITKYAEYRWDTISNSWKGNYRTDSEFNAKIYLIKDLYFIWDTLSGDWFNTNKIDYLYNDSDDIVEELRYHRENVLCDWIHVGHLKNEYTYMDHQTQRISIVYNFDLAKWDTSTKIEIYYNENYQKTMERTSIWQKGQGEWKFSTTDSIVFDLDCKMIEDYYYSWDDENNEWKGLFKTEFKNYINDNYTLVLYSSWDPVSKDWFMNRREELECSPTGKYTHLLGYYWDNSTQWRYSTVIKYDSHDNEYISSFYETEENPDNLKLKSRFYYYYPYSGFVDNKKTVRCYTKIYPGIVNDNLNIVTEEDSSRIDLYDLNGKRLKSFPLKRGLNTFHLGGLKSGIYILKSNSGASDSGTKFLKL